MSDSTSTTDTTTADVTVVDPPKFVAGYDQSEDTRVQRVKVRPSSDGTATALFRGQVDNVERDVWLVSNPTTGATSLYAEVTVDDDTATEVTLAVQPTGKRTPLTPNGDRALRLGSSQRGGSVRHYFLLGVDGSVSRSDYEAEQAKRRAARDAQRALRAQGFDPFDPEEDGDGVGFDD